MDLAFALSAFASIFAIVDPIGTVPFYAALTEGYTQEQKRQVAILGCLVALTTLLVFGLVGQYIFATFGFTIPAFQIAGGILLFGVALEMMHGERPRTKTTEREAQEAFERTMWAWCLWAYPYLPDQVPSRP